MRITPFPGVLTSQMVERPFITKLGNAGCIRVRAWVLTDEQEEWLRRWFPEVDNNLLIKESGNTVTQRSTALQGSLVSRKARRA
jgi:hypothetical protein